MAVKKNANANYVNWNIEDGYRLDINVNETDMFPHRVFKAGLENSFEVFPRTPSLVHRKDCLDEQCSSCVSNNTFIFCRSIFNFQKCNE